MIFENKRKKHYCFVTSLHFNTKLRLFANLLSAILPISTEQTTTSHIKSLSTSKEDYIWCWKSRSWFGTGTKMCVV
jgi:hypothetical protein